EIVDNALDERSVAADEDLGLDLHVQGAAGARAEKLQPRGDDVAEVEDGCGGLEVTQRKTLEIEQAVDERLPLGRFRLQQGRHALALRVAQLELAEELRQAAHRGQGRLQLVREHALRIRLRFAVEAQARGYAFRPAQRRDERACFDGGERQADGR